MAFTGGSPQLRDGVRTAALELFRMSFAIVKNTLQLMEELMRRYRTAGPLDYRRVLDKSLCLMIILVQSMCNHNEYTSTNFGGPETILHARPRKFYRLPGGLVIFVN